MKHSLGICTLLACTLLAGAGSAFGQSGLGHFPEISVGETVTGQLRVDDPAITHRGPFAVYRFEAETGQRLVADMKSRAFDAYLTLARPVGGITEFLDQDDDGGSGTDARLRFRVQETGTYLIIAQALGEGSAGPFSLSLAERPPPEPAVVRVITMGQTVQGELHDGSPLMETEWESEIFFDLYRFEALAGDHIVIDMMSSDFDAYLEFGPLAGTDIELTDRDDDGGDGRDARLRAIVPADGTYGIRARSFGEGQVGRYTLSVGPWEPKSAIAQPIPAGLIQYGSLGVEDAQAPDGSYFQEWTYQGRSGENLHVRMRSDDFDTFLLLGRVDQGEFIELVSNDDAPDDGTNSLIDFVLPASGEYVIRTSSLFSGETGRYSVEVGAN